MSRPPQKGVAWYSLVRTVWEHAGNGRRGMIIFYALSVAANLAILVQPYALGQIFNVLQRGGPEVMANCIKFLGLFLCGTLLFWCFHGPSRVIERRLAFWVRKNFTDRLYRAVTSLPMAWHQDHHSGDTINRINKAAGSLYSFADEQFGWIEMTVRFIAPMVIVLCIDPVVGIAVLGIGAVNFFILHLFDRKNRLQRREFNEREHGAAATLFDYVSNITTVLTLRLEKLTSTELGKRLATAFAPLRKLITGIECKWCTMGVLIVIGEAIALLLYIARHWDPQHGVLLGSAVMLYQYLQELRRSFDWFAQIHNGAILQWTDVGAIEPILEAERRFVRQEPPPLPAGWTALRIDGLEFSYEDKRHHRQTLAVDGIVLERGRATALIGTSGAGKSTLLACLRGIYIPDKGKLQIGASTEPLAALSSVSTLIPQDPEIFEDTLRYNICAGVEHTEEEIQEAVRLACLERVLAELPKGLETNIRERGVNLSGGQKQRLALARGFFAARHAQSELLLLDEPTSSVDAVTEAEVYRRLLSAGRGWCVVASVHRLHLLPSFDQIIWIEAGRATARGTFTELMEQSPAFAQLWNDYHRAHARDVVEVEE